MSLTRYRKFALRSNGDVWVVTALNEENKLVACTVPNAELSDFMQYMGGTCLLNVSRVEELTVDQAV